MMRLISAAMCRLSEASAARVARWFGLLLWHVVRLRRRVTQQNIGMALGLSGHECRRLGRAAYAHLARVAVEFARVPMLTPSEARRLIGDDALATLDRIRAEGKGALVLSAHLGNWDLLACAAGLCGIPVNVITRSIKNVNLNRFWMAQRRDCGVTLWPDRGSAARVAGALRRNEVVAVVLDQHQPGGIRVPFFGRPAATCASLARLARATGAPVVPAFMVRDAGGYRLDLLDPVPLQRTGDGRRDLQANTARYTRVVEQQIRRYPEQWFWVHRRWKP